MASRALVHAPRDQGLIRKYRFRFERRPVSAEAAVLGQEFGRDIERRLLELPLEGAGRVSREGCELLRDIVLANAGRELVRPRRPGLKVRSGGLVWE